MQETNRNILSEILSQFRLLSNIPRGSYNLDGVRSFIKTFANNNNFEYNSDTYGNCYVLVGDKTNLKRINVVIQSHMDMVCVKSEESDHDFTADPIEFVYDYDTIESQSCPTKANVLRANQTTLGADNGIGLVSSMVLAKQLHNQNLISNINLYLLFTADEESGMEGIEELPGPPFLPSNAFVINVDSEIEHEICGGSVGASETIITMPRLNFIEPSSQLYTLQLNGFVGGHSGCDIARGQSSAFKAMAQILYNFRETSKYDIKLVSISGGSAHNSIPEFCKCKFYMEAEFEDQCRQNMNQILESIKTRYCEKNITSSFEKVIKDSSNFSTGMCELIDNQLIDLLMILQQGIVTLSAKTPGGLETSSNIGLLETTEDSIIINCLSRSVTSAGLAEYYDRLSIAANLVGGTISPFKFYEGWAPDWTCSLTLKCLSDSHQKLFGTKPKVYTAHAGLESSVLVKKYPNWDIMSIGPQINCAHTFKENIIISSIESFYDWLSDTIQNFN